MAQLSSLRVTALLAVIITVGVTVPATRAQDAPDDPVKAIVLEFRNLHTSLLNVGGIREDNKTVVEAFQARATALLADHPDHPRLLGITTQLGIWLDDLDAVDDGFRRLVMATGDLETYGQAWLTFFERHEDADDDRVNAIYAQLVEMDPQNIAMQIKWATRLVNLGRYEEAAAAFETLEYDVIEFPDAPITEHQAYMAEHRFDEAKAAVEKITDEVIASVPTLQSRKTIYTKNADDYLEHWVTEQALRSSEAAADDLPRVEIVTDAGRILVELLENEAPNTVANFISLVESEFYDGTKAHYVKAGDYVEGGDPRTREVEEGAEEATSSNPGYRIADEHGADADRKHFAGSLVMNHGAAADSGGSLFYLTMRPMPTRNKRFTVFGRVIDGLDVVRRIEKDDVFQSFRVVRKRDHEYQPTTLPLVDPTTPAPATIPVTPAQPESDPVSSANDDG